MDQAAPPPCPFPALAGSWPVFAGWRVARPLGSGGMGEVFAATRDGVEAALKIIDPARTGAAKARLLAEARAAAAVSHPRLVRCLDLGEESGHPFLVMELVPGGNGDDLLLASPRGVPPAELISFAVDAAEALQALHRAGIIHRDVKPSNLLRGADGRWKLSDFGLARLGDGAPGVTRDGFTVGTPDYMAPEQARGERLDGRADLYALAATLYHLLHGRPPHTAPTAWAVIGKVLTEPFPDPLVVRPDLGAAFAAVVRKLGAKPRDERYDDAQQLLDDLALLRAGRDPVLALRRRAPPPAQPDPAAGGGILLADPDPLVREIHAVALRAAGWPVHEAGDAAEVLEAVVRRRPSVVVVDLSAAAPDPAVLLRRLGAVVPPVPVVALVNRFIEPQLVAVREVVPALVLDRSQLAPNGLAAAVARVAGFTPPRGGTAVACEARPALAVADAILARVQVLMRRLGGEGDAARVLAEVASAAHGLSAAAGAAGVMGAAALAAALEELARQLLASPERRSASTRQTMLSAAAALRAQLVAPAHPRATVRALVVDDEAPGRILASRALEKAGIAHEAVAKPEEALERLRQGHADLVLTDVVMQGMSGFQLAARIRQLPGRAAMPIIFVTGMDDFASFFAAGEGTSTDLIAKPYLVIELTVKVLVMLKL